LLKSRLNAVKPGFSFAINSVRTILELGDVDDSHSRGGLLISNVKSLMIGDWIN